MDRSVLAVGFAAALLLVAPKSFAQQAIGPGPGFVIDVTSTALPFDETGVFHLAGDPDDGQDVYAGLIQLNLATGGPEYVFCVDVFHDLNTNSPFFASIDLATNNGGTTLTSNQKAEMGWLINNWNVTEGSLVGTTKTDLATATQVALWEIEDPGLSWTPDGGDTINPSEITGLIGEAGTMFTGFTGTPEEWQPVTDATGSVPDPSLNQAQGFIGSSGGNTNDLPPVPEPASVLLLAVGLIGLGALRRMTRA